MYHYQFVASFVVRSIFLIAFLVVASPSLADGLGQPGPLPGGLWGPMNGEDEEEIEIEADGVNQHTSSPVGARTLYAMLDELCRRGTVDDHADSFACSTLLSPGRDVVGTIANGQGDDVDVFQIVLGGSAMWRLEIAGAGEVDLVAALYDRSGRRLERADSGGDAWLVRAVRPGTYFVKVESPDGAEGVYALAVDASTR